MKYRAEIDGLRALAVVPVILFHAGFELFSGGFVGVDVFFVISGYLITSILIEDIESKRFSIIDFYERRSRRILPALFSVMLVCIPFAWMWMLPDPLENFGQSLVATTLFVNNVLLFLTSGYWDLASEFKPLLHTWSLGVEEQYYILFPVFLLLAWCCGKNAVLWIIVLVALSSLVLSEWSSRVHPEAAFFLIPTRAWELLFGSIAAFIVHKRGVQKNNVLAIVGLVAIVYSIFAYDETTPFPSLYTLVPVFGVVLLVLFAERETLVARILSIRVMVGIGLVSYSAYLWHQPLFAFSKIYSKTEPGVLQNTVLIVATIVLSYVSWKYIEKPFRDSKVVSLRLLVVSLLSVSLVINLFGYSAHKTHGFVSRVFEESVSPADMYISYNQRNFSFKRDTFENNGKLNVLVVGNSFGRDFVNVLRETYSLRSINLVYRDDFHACSLLEGRGLSLVSEASVVILASNYTVGDNSCGLDVIAFTEEIGAKAFFIGTKQFGFNHNWIARVGREERALLRNPVLDETMKADRKAKEFLPSDNYISLMQPLTNEDGVLVTDELGRLISPDRAHLTKYGAILIGRDVVSKSLLHSLLAKPSISDQKSG